MACFSDRSHAKYRHARIQANTANSGWTKICFALWTDVLLIFCFSKGALPPSYGEKENLTALERTTAFLAIVSRIASPAYTLKHAWNYDKNRKTVIDGYVLGWTVLIILLALQWWTPDFQIGYTHVLIICLWIIVLAGFCVYENNQSTDSGNVAAFTSGALLVGTGAIWAVTLGQYVLKIPTRWVLPIYAVYDAISAQLKILLVNRYRERHYVKSLTRSVVLLGMNYIVLVLSFAYFYQLCEGVKLSQDDLIAESIFFSLSTVLPLGYDEYHLTSPAANWLVMTQAVLGFVFAVFVVGTFVGSFGGPGDDGRAPR